MEKVIIYRSQTEAELDKLLWSGTGNFFEYGVYIIAYVISLIAVMKILENYRWCWGKPRDKKFHIIYSYSGFIIAVPFAFGIGKLFLKLILYI